MCPQNQYRLVTRIYWSKNSHRCNDTQRSLCRDRSERKNVLRSFLCIPNFSWVVWLVYPWAVDRLSVDSQPMCQSSVDRVATDIHVHVSTDSLVDMSIEVPHKIRDLIFVGMFNLMITFPVVLHWQVLGRALWTKIQKWKEHETGMCSSRKYPYLPHGRDFFLTPPRPSGNSSKASYIF